ncbi:uncharacterized protein LOC116172193 [Photinus pyralis]|uniref:Uncharacterized protein n=2 Tax=Photinus pyralis TaxID=7054 RepID=A0A1Y1L295_PHOPY|nr:uncharacterized protein LOC116163790 [Photinus pyralis]XP_031333767.1 uncharacterized protein LOC116163790 [Photinus pyralis]XP_031345212.1 uncharacterized protein LOC116172193 [Photinus pyralis]
MEERSFSSSDNDEALSVLDRLKRLERRERKWRRKRSKRKHRRNSRSPSTPDEIRFRRSRSRSRHSHTLQDRTRRSSASDNESFLHSEIDLHVDQTPGGLTTEENKENSPTLVIDNDVVLDEDVLNIIGEDPEKVKSNTITLNTAICSRWNNFLLNGVPENDLASIKRKYNLNSNLELTLPTINQELSQVTNLTVRKKDSCYTDIQLQIAQGLNALGLSISNILNDPDGLSKEVKESLLLPLWDAGKIFTDLFYTLTKTRRNLLLPILNKYMRDLAEGTTADRSLFGSNFGELVKTAKVLERTSKDLLPHSSNKPRFKSLVPKGREGRQRGQFTKFTPSTEMGNRHRPARYRRESRSVQGRPYKNFRN